MECDVLIQGGEVIDPSQNLRGVRDVLVTGDRITAVVESAQGVTAEHTIDARGLLVMPGLIDLHVHVYPVSPFGLDADPLCPAGGVTTMVDTGTAGSYQFGHFRREVIDRARTQILGLVNLSCMGLQARNLGELLDPRYADPEGVVRTIEEHPGVAVGGEDSCRQTSNRGWRTGVGSLPTGRTGGTRLRHVVDGAHRRVSHVDPRNAGTSGTGGLHHALLQEW